MAKIRTGGQFAVKPLYEYYNTIDGDHPGKRTVKVPLALQVSFRYFGGLLGGADFILLIDRSGSMGINDVTSWNGAKNRWEALLRALREMKSWLRPEDRIALIPFDHTATPAIGFKSLDHLDTLINQLPPPGGGTNFCPAIEAALTLCATADLARPQVILLFTDGKTEMGSPEADIREANRALQLVEQVADAGIDFAALGFGDHYDENFLQKIVARAGLKRVNYIKDDKVAREVFERIIYEQQRIAMTGARVVAILNNDRFTFQGVRSFQPEGTGTVDVKLGKDATIGAFPGRRWEFPLPNIQDSSNRKVDYLLFLEAQPVNKIAPGVYPLGVFELRGRNGEQISNGTVPVNLTVTAKPIKGSLSSPQNPDPDIYTNWRQSKKVDLVLEINELKNTPSAKEKIRQKALAIQEILAEGGPGCAAELAAFETNYAELLSGSTTTKGMKDLNQFISVSTKTAAEVLDNIYRDDKYAVNTPEIGDKSRTRFKFR
jgi:hypothetical protein